MYPQVVPLSATRVALSDQSEIKVYDITNWSLVQVLTGHSSSPDKLVALPERSLLVSMSMDQSLKVWGVNVAGEAAELDKAASEPNKPARDERYECVLSIDDRIVGFRNNGGRVKQGDHEVGPFLGLTLSC